MNLFIKLLAAFSLILIFFLYMEVQSKEIQTDQIDFGLDSSTSNKVIQFGQDATKGCLRFNYSGTEVEFSDDCSTWNDMLDATEVGALIDTDIATHAALTTTHGVSGTIVGTTDSQILSNKTFSNGMAINNDGNDSDTRISGDTDVDLIKVDASTNRVGIGKAAPGVKLDVDGAGRFEEGVTMNNNGADSDTIIKGDTDGALFQADAGNNRVGVGTGAPATKFEVNGVATLGDGSLTKTSAAPTTDAMIANKKYVDDQVGTKEDTLTNSAGLAAALSDESGTGVVLFNNNPDINDPDLTYTTANNLRRLVLPKETTVNLDTLTDVQGFLAYDTTLDTVVVNDGSAWVQIAGEGGGVGSASVYKLVKADDNPLTEWTDSTTNATFAINSTTPISGDSDYRLTNAASADTEYVEYSVTTVPRNEDRNNGIKFAYKYDGTDDYIEARMYDNGNNLLDTVQLKNTGAEGRAQTFGFIEAADTAAKIRFYIVTAEAADLYFNDIVFDDEPVKEINIVTDGVVSYTGFTSRDGSGYVKFATEQYDDSDGLFIVTNSTYTKYEATRALKATVALGVRNDSGATQAYIRHFNSSDVEQYNYRVDSGEASFTGSGAAILNMSKGDYVLIDSNQDLKNSAGENYFQVLAAAPEEAVVHSNSGELIENFTIPWASNFWDAATDTDEWDHSLAVPAFSTSEYITVSDVSSQTRIIAQKPTNITVSVTGIPDALGAVYIYNDSGNILALQIASVTTNGYGASAAISISLDKDEYIYLRNNDPDASRFGAFTLTAGPQLSTMSVITPLTQTCYIKDVKSNGTNGGDADSGSWQTRTLNVLNTDGSITDASCSFATLSSNQFTISPGKYLITASAPAVYVNNHQIKLRNTTDSTDDIIGTTELSATSLATEIVTRSVLSGTVDISSAKTFEIQHRVQTTNATIGFGDNAGFSVSEVYTQVKITRLKGN